ncbi:STAS domain-containing protein [Heyndrickxia ginsengihumi]|uniref:STAS domain-containing protein n=1 Tax=Heyndrickxia ginsengihumi TaxID=363870 RepID=UPI000A7B3959
MIEKQRTLVENLSVPIIPINKDICILPVTGKIDMIRVHTIQDKVFDEIENQHIQILILDLSGAAPMDGEITRQLLKIIEGISMMGCKTIVTGIRAEIVKSIISSGVGFMNQAEFKGTLQVALNDVIYNHKQPQEV